MTEREGDWRTELVEVNRRAGTSPMKIAVAHLHPGEVATSFQQSLINTLANDLSGPQRLIGSAGRLGLISTQSGAGRLERGRNDATAAFLDGHPDADALMFIDSDMGWDAAAVERLATVMQSTGHPIVGGLCFGTRPTGIGAQQSMGSEWFPTLYRWLVDDGGFDTAFEYPPDEVVEVGATGAAFLLIHRRAAEKIRAAEGDCWFDPITVDGTTFGEDLSFCLRARRNDLSVHVDTGVRTSHKKERWYTESDYRDDRRPRSAAVTVVIPVKDNVALTRALVSQLNAQGGFSEILIFDNGSTEPETVEWLKGQNVADVVDASGMNIHEMWNAGIDEAVRRHGGWADVVLLNNDLVLGPKFCQLLVGGLRDTSAMAVCGNYDRRQVSGVQPVRGICAGRYDGSGGLAGFAFALRAEWVATGYRFPTELAWYYGDNDLCLSIEKAGGWYGVVGDASVTHVDGGSQTFGDGPGPTWETDKEAFQKLWPDVRLVAA